MQILGQTVIDLTHPIHPRIPVALGFPRVMVTKYLDQLAGDVATVEIVQSGTHSGTHVDAPMHFVPGTATVDQLEPLALSGTALVIDVPSDGTWVEITASRLDAWEAATGEHVADGDIVLLRTGHARLWSDLPLGSDYMRHPWPYLAASGSAWLVERRIKALGVECADPDRVDQTDLASASFETHRRLLGAGIPIIENLANLDRIPRTRVDFLALALPLRGLSASPIRALALLPAEADG